MKKSFLYAILVATVSFVACDKDKPSPSKPDVTEPPTVIPEADLKLVMDRTTKVLYYGDRKTEGVYNYFFGLGDKEFIKDSEGDDAAAIDGHIIYFDVYAPDGTDSYETAVLPDGKYTIDNTKSVDLSPIGTLDSYYTRMQINEDGKQTSVDFVDGYLEVKTSSKGKTLTALFTLKDGSTVSCLYEGALVFGDPDAGSEPIEDIPAISDNVNTDFSVGMGVYYGDAYNSGIDNYFVAVASESYVVSLSFNVEPASFIYLTPGVYEVNDSYAAGTVEPGFAFMGEVFGSSVVKVDASGNIIQSSVISSGKVTVSESGDFGYKIEVDVVTGEGKTIKGVFDGEMEFEDQSPAEESTTTLTGDYTLNLPVETTTASLFYYGDYFGNGLTNWVLSLSNDNGDAVDIELLTANSSKTEIPLPEKQYNMSVDNGTEGFVAGESSALGQSGTWYWDLSTIDEEGYIYGYAAAIDGWVKLSKDGNNTIVSFEFVDSAYNLFKGSWTGVIPAAIDKSDLSSASTSRKLRACMKSKIMERKLK